MSNYQSKCMYCGSASYGSGCIFSAQRIHIHVDDPTKCIYCGMMAYGSGCIFNPHGNMHIHGMDVGQTIKETTRKTIELAYLVDRLFSNVKESEAYKIGLIAEDGKILRTPDNSYEQGLISPLSKFLYNIKKFISPDSQTAVESLKLLSNSYIHNESIQEYEQTLVFEQEISFIIKQLQSVIQKNINLISHESIEHAIESAIINNHNS